ncbi:MAG TPA: PH domain-containing protein [Acidimicrobiales bacterium]|nr:PH domain-containing protein [Acidimicrobiales bacterium]
MKRLAPGESVVLDVRPHWWFLAGPILVLAVVIAGAITALVRSAPSWADWLVVAALVVAAAWLTLRYLRWVTTHLIVTSTRIVEQRGVLGRSGREIPLTALTDIGYRQSIFERLIGAGDVLIESAGRDGQEVFPDLPHPGRIHNEIYAQMAAARGGPAPAPGIPQQIEQLDQLRRRGVISEEEFEAKKADLLDRM